MKSTIQTLSNQLSTRQIGLLQLLGGLLLVVLLYLTGVYSQLESNLIRVLLIGVPFTLIVFGIKNLIDAQSQKIHGSHFAIPAYKIRSKNVFRLPREGQVYLVLLAVMLLGSLSGRSNPLMLVFALLTGPFVVNGGVSFRMTRALEAFRKLPPRAMMGEPVSVEIALQNHKRFIPSCLIGIQDQITGAKERLWGKLMFAQIPARTKQSCHYQVRFMRRGRYQVGPLKMTSRFPLGIVERGRIINLSDEILIHPRIGILSESWRQRTIIGFESSLRANNQQGSNNDEFHRIREYRQGDERRNIHWRTSARINDLMVREYQQNRNQRLSLLLDLGSVDGVPLGWEDAEHAISLAATIGWRQIRECGVDDLDFICWGKQQWAWDTMSRVTAPTAFLDTLALLESGTDCQIDSVIEYLQTTTHHDTKMMVISLNKKSEFEQRITEMINPHDGYFPQFEFVQARPEMTREFFQPV